MMKQAHFLNFRWKTSQREKKNEKKTNEHVNNIKIYTGTIKSSM
jgi:hypothetical protein